MEYVRAAAGRFAYVEVAAGSADITYWQRHPESIKATYKTRFSKFGEGFVAVELCYISSRWEIRSVHYGLPAIDPRSTTRVMKVFDEIRGSAGSAWRRTSASAESTRVLAHPDPPTPPSPRSQRARSGM
jgi:hypothetical protein